ncbi:hypothetical protein A3F66_04245 [candidate division TM6 bacterium RIFCSPHIGHO2_12_FULL_32_22]|nr:MAG: hypothetical protein A3F66_04245 [candidate division TM6 bacterium RIFCSPHIGHO2_12_FULL_32_22]
MNKKILVNLSTLGPIGNLPASGTWASIFTVLFILGVHRVCPSIYFYFLVTFIVLIASLFVVKKALIYFETPDPSSIVLDEVVGMMITLYGIPLDVFPVLIGLIIFRFLDISKPLIIKKMESLPDIYGIFADDILAAVITNILLRIILFTCLKQ